MPAGCIGRPFFAKTDRLRNFQIAIDTVLLPDMEPTVQDGINQGGGPQILVVEDTLSDSSLLEHHILNLGDRVRLPVFREYDLGDLAARPVSRGTSGHADIETIYPYFSDSSSAGVWSRAQSTEFVECRLCSHSIRI